MQPIQNNQVLPSLQNMQDLQNNQVSNIQQNQQNQQPVENGNAMLKDLAKHINDNKTHHVKFQTPDTIINNNDDNNDANLLISDNDNIILTEKKSGFITLFGMNLPTQTLYLIIIFIIIAFGIWYLGSEKPKKKMDDDKKEE